MGERQSEFSWDFGYLRSPLFSLDEGWSPTAGLPAGVGHDDARQWLASRVRTELFESALSCASSTLVHDLRRWDPRSSSKPGLQIERALMRYYARACRRPTPFGLFAGVTALATAGATLLELPPREAYRIATRLAWPTALELAAAAHSSQDAQQSRSFSANPTIHQAGGLLRYTRRDGDGYSVVDIELTPYLEVVLDRARDRATHAELTATVLGSDPELNEEEVVSFLAALVDNGLLRDTSGPTPCEPLPDPAQALSDAPLDGWRASFEQETSRIAEILHREPSNALLSTVLRKPSATVTLGPSVLDEATRTMELLRRFGEDRPRGALEEFAQSFEHRFGAREVPLLVAADPAYGAVADRPPASHPLLQDLPAAQQASGSEGGLSPELQGWIDEIYTEAVRAELDEITLSAAHLARLRRDPVSLPPSFSLMFSVLENPQGECLLACPGAFGPSGGRLVGRFAQVDQPIAEHLRVHARSEERLFVGAVLAEVNFAPSGRVGNIAVRPRIYPYEITLLEPSTAPRDHQIPVNDLLISLHNDRFVLRSRRLGVEVVPRFTCAYNETRTAFPAAWLLIRLAAQQARSFSWRWGHHAAAPVLPRVRHGRTILAPRRWNLCATDLQPFASLPKASPDSDERGHAFITEMRKRWGWPRYVLVGHGGDALPIDLDNPLSVSGLVHTARAADRLRISEDLFGAFPSAVRGPEGQYANEVVLVGRRATPRPKTRVGPSRRSGRITLGSDCLYTKLYARCAVQDRVLQTIGYVLSQHADKLDRWFFVRYADPESHIRARFFGDPETLCREVLPALLDELSPLVDSDLISNLQIDGYDPETGRYGGPLGLQLAESVFHIDSETYLKVLDTFEDGVDEETRLRICVAGIRDTMANLGWDIDEQIEFCRAARDAFLREFDIKSPKPLASTYRRYRPVVDHALACTTGEEDEVSTLLRWRQQRQAAACRDIASGVETGQIEQPVRDLAWCLNHMFVNRVMPEYPRRSELIAYDSVLRGLTSIRARSRKANRS